MLTLSQQNLMILQYEDFLKLGPHLYKIHSFYHCPSLNLVQHCAPPGVSGCDCARPSVYAWLPTFSASSSELSISSW